MINQVSFKTSKGNLVTVTYEYKKKLVDHIAYFDGWNIPTNKEISKSENMTLEVAGNKFYNCHLDKIDNTFMDNTYKQNAKKMGMTYAIVSGNKVIGIEDTNINLIHKLITDTQTQGTTKEVNDFEENKSKKELLKEINEAKEIIKKAEITIKNSDGTLMTQEQAKTYKKRYNDLYNEGGEGYVPKIITIDMYSWAINIIQSNKEVQ